MQSITANLCHHSLFPVAVTGFNHFIGLGSFWCVFLLLVHYQLAFIQSLFGIFSLHFCFLMVSAFSSIQLTHHKRFSMNLAGYHHSWLLQETEDGDSASAELRCEFYLFFNFYPFQRLYLPMSINTSFCHIFRIH